MRYLDGERLNAIDRHAFRSQQPFPWVNPYGLLIEDGYQRLLNTPPDRSLFTPVFGKKRTDGKYSHDRFSLEYHDDLDIAPSWKEFIAELRGKAYQELLRRLIGARSFELLFYWHYTPRGCSVSPHCDSRRKLGGHIFYFNTAQDWDPAWGGETLILDDGGRFDYRSAPTLLTSSGSPPWRRWGTGGLLFAKTLHSWCRAFTTEPRDHRERGSEGAEAQNTCRVYAISAAESGRLQGADVPLDPARRGCLSIPLRHRP